MAKKKKHSMAAQVAKDEQMDLIDVAPEHAKEILAVARSYRAVETDRIAALKEEVKLKERIIELIKQAQIPPDPDGKTRFRSGKIVIVLEPRDVLVTIKEKKDKKKKKKSNES